MNEQELARMAMDVGNQSQPGMLPRLNPDEFNDECCQCGNPYFEMVYKVKKLSGMHPQNPTGQDVRTVQQVLICTECRTELPQ